MPDQGDCLASCKKFSFCFFSQLSNDGEYGDRQIFTCGGKSL